MTNDDQLKAFGQQLAAYAPEGTVPQPGDWPAAFRMLDDVIGDGKTIVFLDEISWMGQYAPDFPGDLKTAWDTRFKMHQRLILVLCGSVSTWIRENILNNTAFVGRASENCLLKELPLDVCRTLRPPRQLRSESALIMKRSLVAVAVLQVFAAVAEPLTLLANEAPHGCHAMTLEIGGREIAAFGRAQAVLAKCRTEASPAKPVYGYTVPFYAPGGYGQNWWQLDNSVALGGVKWYDSAAAARTLDGFASVMRDDGRIPLWGRDTLPRRKGWFSEQEKDTSSLPAFFVAAHDVAVWRGDRAFAERMAELSSRYLNWWLAARVDAKTGLVTAVFEETFPPYLGWAREVAAPGTCAEVARGALLTADLYERLGKADRAVECRKTSERLYSAARRHLWDATAGLFRPKDVRTGAFLGGEALGFALLIDPNMSTLQRAEVRQSLVGPLFEVSGGFGLTSVPRNDPRFTITRGAKYQGNYSWNGMVWTLINRRAIEGLRVAGFEPEATELSRRTVQMLEREDDFYEFYDPNDGKGCGAKGYAWTAADYLELTLRDLLGVSYDGFADRLEVKPRIQDDFSLRGLDLPRRGRITVRREKGVVRVIAE